ncbi:MAG: 6-phosphogluconolactonase, partial [Betaproteobacteria bacterium]|nr:6-phosphogluconolactonase [Betaproteobacteria bacterium]
LSHVAVPPSQICRAPVEAGSTWEVAAAWERALRAFFGAGAAFPEFDLAVLGIGADGHTASLFPGDGALDAGLRWVKPVTPRGTPPLARVTLTLPVLDHARAVLFLAAGADKRGVIEAIDGQAAAAFPAADVRPRGGALWFYAEAGL